MKNRLEDEYRQLMQNETPDLWERISAGIDAKIATNNEAKDEVTNRGANFWKNYSLPLVACIAAILCVPLMLTGFFRMASGGAKTESAAADMAVVEQNTSVTEATDTSAEEYIEETVIEDEAADEEVPSEAPESVMSEETTEVTMDNSLMEDLAGDGLAESEGPESEIETLDASTEETQEIQGKEQEKADLTQILTVTVISAEQEVLEEERAKGKIYYLMTEEQGECTVFVSSDLSYSVDLNQKLKIVVMQGNDEYDYVFVEMAE